MVAIALTAAAITESLSTTRPINCTGMTRRLQPDSKWRSSVSDSRLPFKPNPFSKTSSNVINKAFEPFVLWYIIYATNETIYDNKREWRNIAVQDRASAVEVEQQYLNTAHQSLLVLRKSQSRTDRDYVRHRNLVSDAVLMLLTRKNTLRARLEAEIDLIREFGDPDERMDMPNWY